MGTRETLEQFSTSGEIIRIYREGLEDGWADGYVAGCGPKFFALEIFDKASRLDGYCCMRYVDVSDCYAAPHSAFKEKALAARKLSRRTSFPLDLSSTANLIKSGSEAFPLVSMFFEDRDDNYCYIGKILSVTQHEVRYLGIDPDAAWNGEPDIASLDAITRIDMGGAYEEALFLVGGRS